MSETHRPPDLAPRRILVVAAHPGDADRGAAGSVAGWIDAGARARLVVVSSGEAGSSDPTLSPEAVAATREAEQRAAADIVGYEDVVFLHQPDGAVANDLATREQLVRAIRALKPDVVLSHDPRHLTGRGGIVHTDHRAVGAAVLDAVDPAAANPRVFPGQLRHEGLEAHAVERVCLWDTDEFTLLVDIGPTLERKVAAVTAHESRIGDTATERGRIEADAAEAGGSGTLAAAEAFAVIDV